MNQYQPKTQRSTAMNVIAVIIMEDTSRFVLTMYRKERQPWYWSFPNDPINISDAERSDPHKERKAADSAIKRIIEAKTGLTTVQLKHIQRRSNPDVGVLHVYLGVAANPKELKVANEKTKRIVETFSLEEVENLMKPPLNHIIFKEVIRYLTE